MTLLLGVLAASIIGSVHCAAMCGAFVCLYAGSGPRASGAPAHTHVAYNIGRLVSYVALGAVAGAIGASVDNLALLAGLSRGAAIVAGTLMIAWAMSVLASSAGVAIASRGGPDWIRRKFGAAILALRNQPASVRAAATGLLTTLLPCGWLYTFVITAAGTGSARTGAAVMLVFWAGTVPMMLGVGFGFQTLNRSILRRLPLASAAVVLVLGVLSITGRLQPLRAASGHTHRAVTNADR
jgi:sulfite exporter TauE/SafE